MKVRVEVVSLNTDGEEQRRQVLDPLCAKFPAAKQGRCSVKMEIRMRESTPQPLGCSRPEWR